jgi:hypothetical protein
VAAAESTGYRDVLTYMRQLQRWCEMKAPCSAAEEERFTALAKVLRTIMEALRRSPDGALLLFTVSSLCWREAVAAILHRHDAPDAISR